MNENLDLIEKLKDVPKETKLWSPICGDCYFQRIKEESCYPIVCTAKLVSNCYDTICFTIEGVYFDKFASGECVLFPSKTNHDWSTFVIPKKHKEFKPFQKVLRRTRDDNDNVIWTADFYSHYDESSRKHFLISGYMMDDLIIIPYDGNEDKLGKKVK